MYTKMDELENIHKIAILPPIAYVEERKFIIYGLGLLGEITSRNLKERYGKTCIECYIQTNPNTEIFNGTCVISLNDLNEEQIQNCFFVLASFTNEAVLRNNLIGIGVCNEQIYSYPPYFNWEHLMEKKDFNIKNITLYPPVSDLKKLNELAEKIQWYCALGEHHAVQITIYSPYRLSGECSQISVVHGVPDTISPEHLCLVWDYQYLNDEKLQNCKYVFCIDQQFFESVDSQMLLVLGSKLLNHRVFEAYNENSYHNFKRLLSDVQNLKKAVIFGTGPSLNAGLEKYSDFIKKNSINMVCNSMIYSKEKMDLIKPLIYVLYDVKILSKELSDMLDYIIHYVANNKCYLIVPIKWMNLLYQKYNGLQDKLIGVENTKNGYCFPTEKKLSVYTKPNNVVTRLMIPIASSLTNYIYFMGCDGVNRNTSSFTYKHSVDLELSDACKNASKSGAPIIEIEKILDDYYCQKHDLTFEELLKYGEQNGKNYYSLTPSFITALQAREKHCFPH